MRDCGRERIAPPIISESCSAFSGALDTEVATYGRFRHTPIQCGENRLELFAGYGVWSPPDTSAPLGCSQACNDTLAGQGAFVMHERAEHILMSSGVASIRMGHVDSG
jgi:hypothetical protein